jgi:hypothetical protein
VRFVQVERSNLEDVAAGRNAAAYGLHHYPR